MHPGPAGQRRTGAFPEVHYNATPLGGGVFSVVVSDTSEPEPDCCLVRGTPDDYAEEVPQAADVLAVFEVAHSSLRSDRRIKQRLYATAGIPIYVIINLQDEVVEVHQQPDVNEQRYDQRTVIQRNDAVSLPMGDLGLIEWNVEDVL